jgi:SAM-dependent methyltransferase
VRLQTELGPITFDPDEQWFEYQDGDDRRRVAFHDYATIYSIPGLYERAFYEELGMCSAEVVVGAYGEALARLGRDPRAERVLDVGAGNGIGGEQIRQLGVAHLVGTDLEPQAEVAAARDRPGLYDEYLTADLMDLSDGELARLRDQRFTSVLALSAVGVGHLPAPALERALGLLEPGGLFAFAVTPALLPGSDDPEGRATGYPDTLARLLAEDRELARVEYVHRRQADGTPHHAVALVGRYG